MQSSRKGKDLQFTRKGKDFYSDVEISKINYNLSAITDRFLSQGIYGVNLSLSDDGKAIIPGILIDYLRQFENCRSFTYRFSLKNLIKACKEYNRQIAKFRFVTDQELENSEPPKKHERSSEIEQQPTKYSRTDAPETTTTTTTESQLPGTEELGDLWLNEIFSTAGSDAYGEPEKTITTESQLPGTEELGDLWSNEIFSTAELPEPKKTEEINPLSADDLAWFDTIIAEAEKSEAEAEKSEAEAEKSEAEAEKSKAEAEKSKAEAEKSKATTAPTPSMNFHSFFPPIQTAAPAAPTAPVKFKESKPLNKDKKVRSESSVKSITLNRDPKTGNYYYQDPNKEKRPCRIKETLEQFLSPEIMQFCVWDSKNKVMCIDAKHLQQFELLDEIVLELITMVVQKKEKPVNSTTYQKN